ncbi:hypothetical protein PTSG_00470 [Salpingoeca rosetta]|uniref:Uncharacterized protein n=1 Tax=Salpingoeca rosetta (strain ATCC 50818 / BSB-021) TaxID=946362 RepID=F2TWK2_SALR5|nr:uncharacterized protein PTSG_00470 [Salpingoeca rosetta]EGD72448.1 hypothetical protein PTSG_00470 [Salpingoeca rosetta]|eukprot:XP_004999017.1 hypothetical protein PTSG_00470 [Salpingoeca rosetta]
MEGVDPLFYAHFLFRRRRYTEAADVCSELLAKNPYDKAAWYLKTRCLTEDVRIDETELEEEGLAEVMLDENAVASVPRPGTSFSRPLTDSGSSRGIRPMSKSGRPVSGFARPGTQGARPSTMEAAVRTARSATSRPVTSASGRYVRLGTASMLSGDDGTFIDVSKLDLRKYAFRRGLARALVLYILHVLNDTGKAMELAAYATEAARFQDWWWKAILGFCYHRLNLFRDAEKQLKSSFKQTPSILACMLLAKVYIRMDQPQNAIQCYREGLEKFPDEPVLLAGIARVFEGIGDLTKSVEEYKKLLKVDSTNVEAIASLAADKFYGDQPEIALVFYRRLLQMGVESAELFNNLGLSCFQAQQYDMALGCFERALSMADDEAMSDIWYNIAFVGMSLGNVKLAREALVLAVTCDSTNGEAYNNLGVIEQRKGNSGDARGHYQTAIKVSPHIHEPHYNYALMSLEAGDLQQAYKQVNDALQLYSAHLPSQDLLKELKATLSQHAS